VRRLPAVLAAVSVLAGQPGQKAEYIGGTLPGIEKVAGTILLTDGHAFRFTARKIAIEIPYDRINLLEYGQKVDRRYVTAIVLSPLFLLSKKRAHFLTVGYTDEQGRQQAAVFRVDKNDIRTVLVSLEARTGQRVQHQDDEARKRGKG
jgi:hypothetical protein